MRFVTTYSVLCLLLLLNLNRIFAQGPEIHSPLDIPLFLSGNFGELRSTHFHAGIDLKTNGQIGQPVKAVASGYVSRVKVQDGGYGNALYVTHANGYTSVYGHLDSFYPELKEYVKEQQYRRKTFEIDLYFEKNKFVVTDGMQIGIAPIKATIMINDRQRKGIFCRREYIKMPQVRPVSLQEHLVGFQHHIENRPTEALRRIYHKKLRLHDSQTHISGISSISPSRVGFSLLTEIYWSVKKYEEIKNVGRIKSLIE